MGQNDTLSMVCIHRQAHLQQRPYRSVNLASSSPVAQSYNMPSTQPTSTPDLSLGMLTASAVHEGSCVLKATNHRSEVNAYTLAAVQSIPSFNLLRGSCMYGLGSTQCVHGACGRSRDEHVRTELLACSDSILAPRHAKCCNMLQPAACEPTGLQSFSALGSYRWRPISAARCHTATPDG
jgi:hypothetical protein